MAFKVGSIFAELGLDTSPFTKGLADSEKDAARWSTTVGKKLSVEGKSIGASFVTSFTRARGAINSLTLSVGNLYRSVFNLRNLLVSGGIALAFRELVQDAALISRAETSFAALAVKIGSDLPTALNRFRTASRGTISDFDIMQSANRAILLGVASNVEQFELLIEAAVRLGQATGRTAAEGFNDLATGIGRQSNLILDNLGIMVDVTKANEDYAKSLGKAESALTETERKTAFISAAYRAIRTSLDDLGPAQDTFSLQVLRATTAIRNFAFDVARRTTPALSDLFFALENLGKQSDSGSFAQAIADGISSMVGAVADFINTSGPDIIEFLRVSGERFRQFGEVVGATFALIAVKLRDSFRQDRLVDALGQLALTFGLIFGQIGVIAAKAFVSGIVKEIVRIFGGASADDIRLAINNAFKDAGPIGRAVGNVLSEAIVGAIKKGLEDRFVLLGEPIDELLKFSFDPDANFKNEIGIIEDLLVDIGVTGAGAGEDLVNAGADAATAWEKLLSPLREVNKELEKQGNQRSRFFASTAGLETNADRAKRIAESEAEAEMQRAAKRIANPSLFQRAMASAFVGNVKNMLDGFRVVGRQFSENIERASIAAEERMRRTLDGLQEFSAQLGTGIADAIRSQGNLLNSLADAFARNLDRALGQTFQGIFSFIAGQGGFLGGLGGFLGSDAFAGILGLGATLINSKSSGTEVRELPIEEIATSSSAVRGVVAGPSSVAISEVGSSIREANRGVENLLREIRDLLKSGRASYTSGGLGAAGIP